MVKFNKQLYEDNLKRVGYSLVVMISLTGVRCTNRNSAGTANFLKAFDFHRRSFELPKTQT